MLRLTLVYLTTASLLYLGVERSDSFKTPQQLKTQFKKIENDTFSTSDALVGRAMDFIYSNKTIMSLIARELWNVGSRAIDKIVDLKDKTPPKYEYNKK